MALDTIDNIRDAAISSGIGNSGLTSQAVQRANIEELRSLRAAISESQATRENMLDDQKYKLAQELVKNPVIAKPKQTGILDPSRPNITIGQLGNRITLGIPGQNVTPDFETVDQALDYLQQQGLNRSSNIITNNPFLTLDETTRNRLQSKGLRFLDNQTYRKIVPEGKMNFNPGQVVGKLPEQAKTPQEEEMQNLATKPEEFTIGKLEPNAQAKLVSGYYNRLQVNARKGNVEAMNQYDMLKGALVVGKGRQLVEAAVRSGYYNG